MARIRLILIIAFAVVGGGVSLWFWFRNPVPQRVEDRIRSAQTRLQEARHRPDVVQGEIAATQFNVAAKIAGRISVVLAAEGQTVAMGAPLVEIDSPDLQAKRDQARAAQDQAAAMQDKAEQGARPEEIDQARGNLERAEAAESLARLTFERMERLFRDGVIPQQRRDEAETQWKASASMTRIARASVEMAEKGTRDEDRAAARAAVRRAEAAVAEVDAYAKDLLLRAPQTGEVVRVNAEPGELIGPGFPIMTIRGDDRYLVLQLREDRLAAVKTGSRIRGQVPALGGEAVEFEVYQLAAQADFATSRATSAAGGFDLRTFEIRARPLSRRNELRPGMSVVIDWGEARGEEPAR